MPYQNKLPTQSSILYRRIAAFFIDLLLFTAFATWLRSLLSVNILELPLIEQLKQDATNAILFAICLTLFQSVFFNGASIGKKIFGLKVYLSNGNKANFYSIVNREFIGRLLLEKANIWLVLILAYTGIIQHILNIPTGTVRSLLYYAIILPWPMFFSFIYMLNDPMHRSLHDIIAGTQVVYVKSISSVVEKEQNA